MMDYKKLLRFCHARCRKAMTTEAVIFWQGIYIRVMALYLRPLPSHIGVVGYVDED